VKDIKFFKVFYQAAESISYLYLIPEEYVDKKIFNQYINWSPVGAEKRYTNYILLDFFIPKESNNIKKKISYFSVKKIFRYISGSPSLHYCVYLHRIPEKKEDISEFIKDNVVNIKGISDKVVNWVKGNI